MSGLTKHATSAHQHPVFSRPREGVRVATKTQGASVPVERQTRFLVSSRYLSVDIDGTIADVTKRKDFALNHAPDKSREFYEVFLDGVHYHMDEPVIESRDFLLEYIGKTSGRIVYLSGRREGTEHQTQLWLDQHNFPPGDIIHRRKGFRSSIFKSYWLSQLLRKGIVDGHIGDRIDDDGGAAKECGIRFVHINDHRWPSYETIFPSTVN